MVPVAVLNSVSNPTNLILILGQVQVVCLAATSGDDIAAAGAI